MYTSDKHVSENRYSSVIGAYLFATGFCALFGAVYELFGHEVYSYFMIYAFAFPLLLGAVPFFLMQKRAIPFPGKAADLLHAGVAALTVGSIVQGVLEIYGTSNPLTVAYWLAGGTIIAVGWLSARSKRGGRA